MCWSTETGTFKYKVCVEKSFVQENDWLRFCKTLIISGVAGPAVYLVRGIAYDGNHRIRRCIFLEKAV